MMIIKINLLISALFFYLLLSVAIADTEYMDTSATMSKQDIQAQIKLLQKELDKRNKTLNLKNSNTINNTVTKHLLLTQDIKKIVNKNTNKEKELDFQVEARKLRRHLEQQFSYLSKLEIDLLVEKFEDNHLEGLIEKESKNIPSTIKVKDKTTTTKKNTTPISKKVNEITAFLKQQKAQELTKKIKAKIDPRLVKEGNATITELLVKQGDTLCDIAQRNYGNANMYMPIFMANKDKLNSPHIIPSGIKLKIPSINSIKNWKANPNPNQFKKQMNNRKKITTKKTIRKNKKTKSHRSMEELARLILGRKK